MMICDPEVACILVYLGEREQEVSMRDILDAKPRSEWLQLIQQWIHNETDREMITRRLLDGKTYEQLCDEFGTLQIDQIKRRISRAQKQLISHAN